MAYLLISLVTTLYQFTVLGAVRERAQAAAPRSAVVDPYSSSWANSYTVGYVYSHVFDLGFLAVVAVLLWWMLTRISRGAGVAIVVLALWSLGASVRDAGNSVDVAGAVLGWASAVATLVLLGILGKMALIDGFFGSRDRGSGKTA